MQWVSALSIETDPAAAVAEVVAAVGRDLDGHGADLAILFASSHHAAAYDGIGAALAGELGDAVVLGCSAGGVIGGGREIERLHGLSLTVASLPGVDITPFACEMSEMSKVSSVDEIPALLGVQSTPRGLLMLPEPFSFAVERVLPFMDAAFDGIPIVGGLASGATEAGENGLFLRDQVLRSGAVGVALSGNVTLDSLVAQGCRPIGEPMFITSCERNLIRQLDGKPAFDVLRDLVDALPAADLELARHSLFVGLVMLPKRERYEAGDFLIRNLIGVDPDSGVVGVGGMVEEGSVLCFHLRDGQASSEDLTKMLERHASAVDVTPSGALLFSCLGRGEGLYGEPGHDSRKFSERFGEVPTGGFFCNGEIGPVLGRTYLHGYTSSFALFRPGNSN